MVGEWSFDEIKSLNSKKLFVEQLLFTRLLVQYDRKLMQHARFRMELGATFWQPSLCSQTTSRWEDSGYYALNMGCLFLYLSYEKNMVSSDLS
jgi:hypothetical protein